MLVRQSLQLDIGECVDSMNNVAAFAPNPVSKLRAGGAMVAMLGYLVDGLTTDTNDTGCTMAVRSASNSIDLSSVSWRTEM